MSVTRTAGIVAAAVLACTGLAATTTANAAERAAAGASADYWPWCWTAPAGSLEVRFVDDDTDCFSGTGWVGFGNDWPNGARVATHNNWGVIHINTNGREWDLNFDRNQVHTLPPGSKIYGVFLNTRP
ncbi:hypothetical protein [Streptomyces sp. 8N706]|uniref:hypothetical protein n=1 Tax=Streptomyces sp. 8N706 TaxID=3457416 RepID=UPI003FD27D25